MLRLALVLFAVIATSLMGAGVIAVLSMGMDTGRPIVLAALAGFLVAIPVSWLVARAILNSQKPG
jgi:hypothetical protein